MASDNYSQDQRIAVLKGVVGARLTSVQFVMNYLILGFDERGALTTLVWPDFQDGQNTIRYGMQGYRDGLCSLIEHVTTDLVVSEDETITVTFDNGNRMEIPLRSYKGKGERAIFTNPKHETCIW